MPPNRLGLRGLVIIDQQSTVLIHEREEFIRIHFGATVEEGEDCRATPEALPVKEPDRNQALLVVHLP